MEQLRDPACDDYGSETGWGRDVPEIRYLSPGLAVFQGFAARMNSNLAQDGVEWFQHLAKWGDYAFVLPIPTEIIRPVSSHPIPACSHTGTSGMFGQHSGHVPRQGFRNAKPPTAWDIPHDHNGVYNPIRLAMIRVRRFLLRIRPTLVGLVFTLAPVVAISRGPGPKTMLAPVAVSGLPATGKSFGATWADLNRDGRPDLLISLHGLGVGCCLNQGGLRFAPAASCTLLPSLDKDNHGTAACDFDGDGRWEFYVSVGARRGKGEGFNELWDWNADGNLHDIIDPSSPLCDPQGRGRGATWVDLDARGNPELLVLGFRTPPRLFHFDGNTWHEWSDQIDRFRENRLLGQDPQMIYWRTVAAPGDFDGDGREDLYVAGASSIIYRNTGGRYQDVTEASGLPPFPAILVEAVPGDVDNDGDLDLLTVQQRPGKLEIWLNESTVGNIRFIPGPSLENLEPLPWMDSAVLADFDNDGQLDLYATGQIDVQINAPNLIARGNGDGSFTLATAAWGGAAPVPALPCGAWAMDVDGDGDLDLLALHGKEDFPRREGLAVLYENTTEKGGITLNLIGADGGLMPLGTVAKLTTSGHRITRQIRSHISYWNSTVPPLHFGVGNDAGPFNLEIIWPGGRQQEIVLPTPHKAYTLIEGRRTAIEAPTDSRKAD